jgi:TRAP-type uncharacterized transport system fused permease subunit
VAIAAFAAAGIAGADPMKTGWAAVRFGWMAYIVPLLFVMSPTLLLIGDTLPILQAIVTALIGVWLVSIAVAGYFLQSVRPLMRLGFLVSGLLALMPAQAFPGAEMTDVAGGLMGLGFLVMEFMAFRRRKNMG